MTNSYMTDEEIIMEKITQILETSTNYRICENQCAIAEEKVMEFLKQVSDQPLSLIDTLDNARTELVNATAKECYLRGMKDAFALMTSTPNE